MTTHQNTITLANNSLIRLPLWSFEYCEVGTTAGYAAKYGESLKPGQINEAWANYNGTCLCSDAGYCESEANKLKTAITVNNGDIVTIDGINFQIKVMPGCEKFPRYSDPIHFIRC